MTRASRDSQSVDFAYLLDESGRLDRRLPANLLFVPARVEVEKDRLIWTHQAGVQLEAYPYCSEPPKFVVPGSSLLDDFLRLADGFGEAVARYARRWGILGICRHNLPRTHHRSSIKSELFYDSYCTLRTFRRSPDVWSVNGWEPLAAWHRYARKAKSILDAAGYLHRGEAVTEEKITCGLDDFEAFRKVGRKNVKAG